MELLYNSPAGIIAAAMILGLFFLIISWIMNLFSWFIMHFSWFRNLRHYTCHKCKYFYHPSLYQNDYRENAKDWCDLHHREVEKNNNGCSRFVWFYIED